MFLENRRKTREINVGKVKIGNDNPVSIQSMTNTKTADVVATVEQIRELSIIGCDIIRVAVPDLESAEALPKIIEQIDIPLIADIHFDYKLALKSIENGVDGLRLNPGNIGSVENVKKVVQAAKEKNIPIRIGVNSGSLEKEKLEKYGVTAQAIVESALDHVKILENEEFYNIKISVKGSSVPLTIESYRLLSSKVDYPLHLGVTEAGTEFQGSIKSSIGIGTLLAEGIGDTIRVSLTSSPLAEIKVAKSILRALHLRNGLEIISCPTCGRTNIDLIGLAKQTEEILKEFEDKNLSVAVMGCVVHGPGEAREADFGIAGGINEGLIFQKGEIIKKVAEEKLVPALRELIIDYLKEEY
ncbi:MAG: flavodoxin-dependent (E)-4-hydroxy-3-methylbut-2-enyl-diphosphate synthase [Candidatus Cloacimonadota bacterium]|nr:flavodoxin-dependent (E)-4-hydroxy-3-methylbut-2-enyl-diphosphate synthase [Candidatus Cloacimonadota bacterium]